MKFGIVTDTWDAEGEIIRRADDFSISRKCFEDILVELKGDFHQTPPVFSAKKIKGKPSYYYARNKIVKPEELILNPVMVRIDDIRLLSCSGDMATINLKCSSGTYVRSVVNEIGNRLRCGATLTGLVRTGIGKFKLDDSIGFEQLEKVQDIESGRPGGKKIYSESIISVDNIVF